MTLDKGVQCHECCSMYMSKNIPKENAKEKFNRKKIGVSVGEELIQLFRFVNGIGLITKIKKDT